MVPADAKLRDVLLGLGDDEAGRVEALRQRGEFFWLDLDLELAGSRAPWGAAERP